MRIIAHIDMDAFFASVEERDKEWLNGLPIVIGSDPQDGKGRGVVSTANYKAREYGIKSAVPISIAWKLSEEAHKQGKPRAVFITPNMEKYSAISARIMAILRSYAEHIEEASIDEAYFDLSPLGSYEKAAKVAEKIREEIVKKESLTASIGIGPNKLVAKIASDFKSQTVRPSYEKGTLRTFSKKSVCEKYPASAQKWKSHFGSNTF
jgi:DNA polymerase IV (DinB-like DNA polymerase)